MTDIPERTRALMTLAAEGDVTDGELSALAHRLHTARTAIAALTSVVEALTMEVAARVEDDETIVAGYGSSWSIARGYKRTSTWSQPDSAELLRHDLGEAVVAKIALDVATGELDPAKRNIARAAIAELWEVLPAFSSLKAGAKRLGIHIDQYRQFTDVATITLREQGDLT